MTTDQDDSSTNDGAMLGTMRNPVEFREWFKILFRLWRPALTPNQFLVALFIFDRTAAWGKEWETITRKHFLEGVCGSDGRYYASGLVLTRPTLQSALAELRTKGAIRTAAKGRCMRYALNYEWNPTTMPLRIPKRLQTTENLQTVQSEIGQTICPMEGQTICPKEKKREQLRRKGNATHSPVGQVDEGTINDGSLETLLASAKQRASASRNNRKRGWTAQGASAAWLDFCKEGDAALPVLALTKEDGVILHRYGKRWMKTASASVDDWFAFLAWVTSRWSTIRSEHFGWMQANSPASPSIRFLVRFSDRFEQAWHSRRDLDRMATMTTREREVERLMRKGMDRSTAEREADERLGLAREKQEAERALQAARNERLAAAEDHAARRVSDAKKATWTKRRQAMRQSAPQPDHGTLAPWDD